MIEVLFKKLNIKTCEEQIEEWKRKTYHHISNWKIKKRLQKNRKRMIRKLKKSNLKDDMTI